MDKKTFTIELFRKFLDGNCSLEEKAIIQRYLDDPQFEEDIDSFMLQSWDEALLKNPEADETSKKRYAVLREKMQLPRQNHNLFFKIAATAIIILCCSFILLYHWHTINNYINPVTYINHQTKPGEQLLLNLPDGSKVWLNASSNLRYPENFDGDTRELFLRGEAFFEVSRDAHKPFVVHTRNFYTRVLGTSFNIEAYSDDSTIDVTVATGKVAVGILDSLGKVKRDLTSMTPNHHIRYDLENDTWQYDSISAAQRVAWHEGRLVFKHCALHKAIKVLERWYNVTFDTTQMTATNCTITADFREKTSLNDVLQSLKLTGLIDYKMTNIHRVVLISKPCRTSGKE